MPYLKLLGDRKKSPPKKYINDKPRDDRKRRERQAVYQSKRYRSLREQKRRDAPICEIHDKVYGKTVMMEHVHHWRSFVGQPRVDLRNMYAFDYQNLVSVCRSCHDRLHVGDLKGCTSIAEVAERIKKNEKTDKQ